MNAAKKAKEIAGRYAPTRACERNLAEDILDYGSRQKQYGARSFAKLVKQMRDMQQAFFRQEKDTTAKRDYLKKAKRLEEQVDRSIEIILK